MKRNRLRRTKRIWMTEQEPEPQVVAVSEEEMMQMMASSAMDPNAPRGVESDENRAVSYTHLTLPTIYSV